MSVSEDAITNLSVNGNSSSLNQAGEQAVNAISKQISDDCDRITSMAVLFEEKDRTLAGSNYNG